MRRLFTVTVVSLVLAGCSTPQSVEVVVTTTVTPPAVTVVTTETTLSTVEPAPLGETSGRPQESTSSQPKSADRVQLADLVEPISIGAASMVGSWEVTVGETEIRSLAEMAKAGLPAPAIPTESEFATAGLHVTYRGDAAARVGADLEFSYVSALGDIYSGGCGDLPGTGEMTGLLGPDEFEIALACAVIPSQASAGGIWRIEDADQDWVSYYAGAPGGGGKSVAPSASPSASSSGNPSNCITGLGLSDEIIVALQKSVVAYAEASKAALGGGGDADAELEVVQSEMTKANGLQQKYQEYRDKCIAGG